MKSLVFARRNRKEILRDPLNLAFGIGFPIIILFLLSAIQANVPVNLFEIQKLTPGIAVFGLSFISLFSATLISKDRTTSFLARLFTSPLSSTNFILGYTLPLLPMAIVQIAFCFVAAFFLKLPIDINILMAIFVLIPAALFFIAFGLFAGTIFNDKQVGGICGALLTNISAWLSGTWFDLNLVGGWFKKIADILPFSHSVNVARAAIVGNYSSIFPELWWVIGYAIAMIILAVIVFSKKMRSDSI